MSQHISTQKLIVINEEPPRVGKLIKKALDKFDTSVLKAAISAKIQTQYFDLLLRNLEIKIDPFIVNNHVFHFKFKIESFKVLQTFIDKSIDTFDEQLFNFMFEEAFDLYQKKINQIKKPNLKEYPVPIHYIKDRGINWNNNIKLEKQPLTKIKFLE